MSRHWGVILAGGDGVRLRSMTRSIAGDDRPKQFCPLVGEETLLTATRRRAALAVPAHRTLVVVNRAHERFYTPLLADLRTRLVVAQPENRGTAPAILYALLTLATRQAASDTVVFYPSDHFVSDDAAFSGQIEEAQIIGQWLRSRRGGDKVEISVPHSGQRRELVKMAAENAAETLQALRTQWQADSHKQEQALANAPESREGHFTVPKVIG